MFFDEQKYQAKKNYFIRLNSLGKYARTGRFSAAFLKVGKSSFIFFIPRSFVFK